MAELCQQCRPTHVRWYRQVWQVCRCKVGKTYHHEVIHLGLSPCWLCTQGAAAVHPRNGRPVCQLVACLPTAGLQCSRLVKDILDKIQEINTQHSGNQQKTPASRVTKISFIGYSLGGLIIRCDRAHFTRYRKCASLVMYGLCPTMTAVLMLAVLTSFAQPKAPSWSGP